MKTIPELFPVHIVSVRSCFPQRAPRECFISSLERCCLCSERACSIVIHFCLPKHNISAILYTQTESVYFLLEINTQVKRYFALPCLLAFQRRQSAVIPYYGCGLNIGVYKICSRRVTDVISACDWLQLQRAYRRRTFRQIGWKCGHGIPCRSIGFNLLAHTRRAQSA